MGFARPLNGETHDHSFTLERGDDGIAYRWNWHRSAKIASQ
jgi:hypothetical protein